MKFRLTDTWIVRSIIYEFHCFARRWFYSNSVEACDEIIIVIAINRYIRMCNAGTSRERTRRTHHKLRAQQSTAHVYSVYLTRCNALASKTFGHSVVYSLMRLCECIWTCWVLRYELRVGSFSWPPSAFRMRENGFYFYMRTLYINYSFNSCLRASFAFIRNNIFIVCMTSFPSYTHFSPLFHPFQFDSIRLVFFCAEKNKNVYI